MLGPVTVYDGEQRREVFTLLEFEAWLDALAAVGHPRWIEITTGAGSGVLAVALGRGDLSALRFTSSGAAATQASTGTLRAVLGGYDFADRGARRPVQADEAIPVPDARAAAREFAQTGHRPTGVDWHPADPLGSGRGTPPAPSARPYDPWP